MERSKSKILLLFFASLFAVYIATVFNVAANGRSVEDLVGVFSIQKTVKLGSSNDCLDGMNEPLDSSSSQNTAYVDDRPPVLAAFSIEPTAVNSSSSQSITLEARILDDQSPLPSSINPNSLTVWFVSPSGRQTANATLDSRNLIAGDRSNGTYTGEILLTSKSEAGVWRLHNLTLSDGQGNSRVYDYDQMFQLGFPAQFFVI